MPQKWLKIENKSDDKGEIFIYGDITDEKWYDEDVTPKWFKEEVDRLKGFKNIDMFVNSGGGGVFAGMAIYNILKRVDATVTAYVDGIAASTASWLIQAADKVVMPENALMMIHNPMTFAFGNATEIRKTADTLDKIRDVIVDSYSRNEKLDRDKIVELMDVETWMDGNEALEYGFIDEVIPAKKITSSIDNAKKIAVINGIEIDTSKFQKFPKEQKQPNTNNFKRIIDARKKLFNIKREVFQ